MTPIGRPVAAVRGGAAALPLELLLAEHCLGEGERLFKIRFGYALACRWPSSGRNTWRCVDRR
jgi:hypothetical protein